MWSLGIGVWWSTSTSLISSLLSKLKARSTYFENKACTKNTLGDLNSEGLLEKASIITTPTAYSNGFIHSVKPEEPLGNELITNGDFATDSDWNKASNWTISGGAANADGSSGGQLSQVTGGVVIGRIYKLEYTILNYVSGSFRFSYGGTSESFNTGNGTYTTYRVATSTNSTILSSSINFIGSIDNVSVKELTDADFTFTRNSPATRVNSQGIIENVQILSGNLVQNGDFSEISSELVTNGDFATDSDWTKQTSWSISGGSANYDFLSDSKYIRQTLLNGGFVAGKTYKINFEITSGTAYMNVNSNASGLISINTYSVGSYSIYVTPSISASDLLFYGRNTNGTAFSIDNISVKELDPNDEWNTDSSCTIEIGEADFLSSTSNAPLYQSSSYFTIGKTYKITYTVSNYSSGRINWNDFGAGAGNGVNRIANGTYTEYYLKVGTSTNFGFQTNFGFTGSITDISVIEITHDTDLPRIDYTDGCGSLLLEPQATNTATDSNDFTTGDIFEESGDPTLTGSVLTSAQAISPDGTNNAWKLVDNNDGLTSQCALNYFNVDVISENYNTVSLFVKKQGDNDWVYINNFGYDATSRSWFNISNGTLGTVASGHTASIDDYGNGWYRIAVTFTTEFDLNGSVNVRLATSNNITNITRDGTNGVYIYGLQAESHATREYATSYIPTSGDIQTRGADSSTDAGSSDLINSTEGVLYAEIATLSENNETLVKALTLGFDITNKVMIYTNVNSRTLVNIRRSNNALNSSVQVLTPSESTNFNKIAISYKSGQNKIFVNGSRVTDTVFDSFTFDYVGNSKSFNKLEFANGSGVDGLFEGKVKCVAVFKEALTDAELAALTTI